MTVPLGMSQITTEHLSYVWSFPGTKLALRTVGGCSMRSLALVKIPGTALAFAAAAALAQVANLSSEIPLHQLQLAWTLTRVLIQL